MTEAGLRTLIETALSIPVFEGKESITYPSATLEVLKIDSVLFGDGHSVARTAEAQINLWYKDKEGRDAAVETLITTMDAQSDITSPDIETYYDTTAKKYRAVLATQYTYRIETPAPTPEPTPEPDEEPEEDPAEDTD